MNFKKDAFSIINIQQKLSYKDLIIFLIPFIIFLCYLHAFDPGILRFDSFTQLNQIASNNFSNWHPFFHTFIEMICLKIFPNPKSIAFLQILLFSIIWTAICSYFRHENNSITSKDLQKEFILQILVTLIISFIPINAIYSITLLKDTLFSYFLLLSCFLIKILLDKKGNVNYYFIILLSLSMAFVSQLRPNGNYVILIFLVILAIHLYKQTKNKKLPITIISTTLIFIVLIASLNVIYEVEDNEKDALYTKAVHMLSDYDLNHTMNSQDSDKIHEIVNESLMKDKYIISESDGIYSISNQTPYDNDKTTFINLAIKYSLLNPIHFLKYMFESAPMVWDILSVNNWHGIAYSTNTNEVKDVFYEKYNISVPYYDDESINYGENDVFNFLNPKVKLFNENPVLNALFFSPALYMYLSLILIGEIYLLTRSKDLIYVYLPNALNIIIIFMSTPIQDYRYLYPNLLLFYLLVIIFINVWYDSNNNSYYISAKNPIVKEKTNENYINTQNNKFINIQNHEKPKKNLEKNYNPEIYDNIENTLNNLSSRDINLILKNHPKEEKTTEEMENQIRQKILKEMESKKNK